MKQTRDHGGVAVGTFFSTQPEDYDPKRHIKMDAGETAARQVEINASVLFELVGGMPDVVIYNAGRMGSSHYFDKVQLTERAAQWQDVLATNVVGPVLLYHTIVEATGHKHHAVHTFTGSVGRVVLEKIHERGEGLPPGNLAIDPYAVSRTATWQIGHDVNDEIMFRRTVMKEDIGTRIAVVEYQFVPSRVGDGVVKGLGVPHNEAAASLTPHGKPVSPEVVAKLGLGYILDRYNAEPGAKMGDTLIPPRK